MALTDEQRERIRKNRERAMEIRRRKLQEAEAKAKAEEAKKGAVGTNTCTNTKLSNQSKEENATKSETNSGCKYDEKEEETEMELEDFEIDASPYVTKQEAMKNYCLPAGTLEVCDFIEKDNPRQAKWSKMKLYHRSEIRRRARERWGGLEKLQEERRRREHKRSEKDMEEGYRVFNKKQKK